MHAVASPTGTEGTLDPSTFTAQVRRILALDLALYLLSAAFALVTAVTSTLAPHRAWGAIAWYGYAAAGLAVLAQLALPRRLASVPARAVLTGSAWLATTILPLLVQAAQRAAGRTDRAQEEVLVTELAGERLLHTGTPYLGRDAIAALPADERLLGYTPYQPGMALFGVPRALGGVAWWTDARVWFAVATAAALAASALILVRRPGSTAGSHDRGVKRSSGQQFRSPIMESSGHPGHPGHPGAALLRAAQAATVLPICALTLATGGDDLPVLGLCLLALACVARADAARAVGARGEGGARGGGGTDRRWLLAAGLAVGAAGALKLLAWPVALVLLVTAAARGGRRGALAFAVPAGGLPVLALAPAFGVDAPAAVENVLRFPLGQGLVTSPAQSPLPGHLIATGLPGGRVIATVLLVLAGAAIGLWLLRRPPRDAASAAAVCAVGMVTATLLLPATRFGYLLYPVAYVCAVPVLRLVGSRGDAAGRTQVT